MLALPRGQEPPFPSLLRRSPTPSSAIERSGQTGRHDDSWRKELLDFRWYHLRVCFSAGGDVPRGSRTGHIAGTANRRGLRLAGEALRTLEDPVCVADVSVAGSSCGLR